MVFKNTNNFSSTCATWTTEDLPITENTIQSINPYGRSKLIIENILHDYSKAYNLPSLIYRYFNASGCDPNALIGEEHDPETHLIPLVFKAIDDLNTLKIFGDDYDTKDGSCIRDYIHVCDIADAHILGLDFLYKGSTLDNKRRRFVKLLILGTGMDIRLKRL